MKRKPRTLRIIGGCWRRRLITFPDVSGLRPTQDRIRETLFNWLMPYLKGASCLDLFAGSGALGFEALSRGASCVTFMDSSPQVIAHVKKNANQLEVDPQKIEIIMGSFPDQNTSISFCPYDIVFLDPPFHKMRLSEIIDWLESNTYLKKNALIYLESETQSETPIFQNYKLLKKGGGTSSVSYYLLQRN